MKIVSSVFVVLAALASPLGAQEGQYPSRFSAQLAESPTVRDALQYIDDNFGNQVEEWIRITEIPAQSQFEAERGEYVAAQLRSMGYEVSVDSIGNVIAKRPGTGGGPTVVFAAHMDTVHPLDTDVTVTRRSGRLYAPGIFDNSASTTNMLQAARAIANSNLTTRGDVIFIATVQEELGLKGMSYWLDTNPGVADMLVSLDGGLGPVAYGALGIYWSRMIFEGDGAHTMNSRGRPHPGRAAAQCILDLYTVPVPPARDPVPVIYNVGMLQGGKVVNAIPQEVWFTVDLRTVDPILLQRTDRAIVEHCEAAALVERVSFRRDFIQQLEAGGRPEDIADRRAHPLVQTSVDILTHLGFDFGNRPTTRPTGSTDANAAVIRGIPAVAVGRSLGGDQHTISEWSDIESARIGTKQIILLVAAMAELADFPAFP
ncbi:MAG: M20/M25/M40 family metallo-hydrolase [Gemmatimonadota bacterium]|nr:M20/M25/M40 family metallo-hydrolase [Gemmatimonadota bacterium]